jgi:hypothetical protein
MIKMSFSGRRSAVGGRIYRGGFTMFPNNVSFIARERDRERYQEAEHIRLIKIARLQQDDKGAALREIGNWLGSQMVKWGAKLQHSGSAPLPKASPIETIS